MCIYIYIADVLQLPEFCMEPSIYLWLYNSGVILKVLLLMILALGLVITWYKG